MDRFDRIAGCLLGGAVGDALGAPVEFVHSISSIRQIYGDAGIQDYPPEYGGLGAVTDDTQMTIFTLEGILRWYSQQRHTGTASLVDCVRYAYIRWLGTQEEPSDHPSIQFIYTGWLWQQPELHSRRGPGRTCLSSLWDHLSLIMLGNHNTPLEPPNNSKGCGAVMRMAPVGFFELDHFKSGCQLGVLTHGHPSGYLAAGFLAHTIARLMEGTPIEDAVLSARTVLTQWPGHKEVMKAVDHALDLAHSQEPVAPETVELLGEGWVAEEALAIAIFCALKAENFVHGVRVAVNHGGDSDSTGAITGNLLGAALGKDAIPKEMADNLEVRDILLQMAEDAVNLDSSEAWMERYPADLAAT